MTSSIPSTTDTNLGPDAEGAVLLGIGPSGHLSSGTVDYAVTMATRLSLGIEVVHVVPTISTGPLGTWEVGVTADELVAQGQAHFDEAVARVRERTRGAQPVTGQVLRGNVIDALVERSALAQLVVLERRQVSRWTHLTSGSVTAGVAARAHAPVVSVPASWQPSERVLPVTVAVGDGARAASELWTALGLTAVSNQPIVALRATYLSPAIQEMLRHELSRERIVRSAHLELERDAELPDDVRKRLDCTYKVKWGRTGDVLVEASHHSSALVIARRDPSTPIGSHLGPVVRQVLREATCPVLVVEPTLREPVVTSTATGAVPAGVR